MNDFMERAKKPIIILLIALILALFSILFAAPKYSSVSSHQADIEAIDDKIQTVLQLTGTSAVASVAASAIPGDTGTPIAEKLADFSEYFLVILCVLYAEKYLLTILGLGAFKIILPLAIVLLGLGFTGLLAYRSERFKKIGFKLLLFGIGLYWSIPAGLRVSDMIYETYEASISSTISAADALSAETAEIPVTEDQSIIEKFLGSISETVEGLTDKAVKILKQFTETLAVLIVTSCVIPLLVILFIFLLIRMLTGIDPTTYIPTARHGKIHLHKKNVM